MATTVLSGSPSEVVAGGIFKVSDNNPTTIIISGLAGAETIDLEITPDGGTTWIKVDDGGTQRQFKGSPAEVVKVITAPGSYRLNKTGSTTSAVTGYIATSIDP